MRPETRAAALTALVFLPSLFFPFLAWDDAPNLLTNPSFGPPSWAFLKWAFTTHHYGPYQPLSWLSLSLDRALWGLNPFGYHLTNIMLHSANAALAYACARLLWDEKRAWLCALLFALHPLRAESVAWITERRDVLSGFFFLGALLLHLRKTPRAWVLAAYAAAILSKGTAVGLVWILIALDKKWKDKMPFFAVAIALGCVGLWAFKTGDMPSVPLSLGERLRVAGHGAAFYLWKTILPIGLSPYYELKSVSWLGALVSTALLPFEAWRLFLLILAPVSGLLQNGLQLAADRYTYLAGLPLAAAGAAWLSKKRWAAAVPAVLAALTVRQTMFWRDDITLWSRAVAVEPASFFARSNLATALFVKGDPEAEAQYEAVLTLRPGDPQALLNLGALAERRGDHASARRRYEALGDDRARQNLAVLLLKEGRWDEAEKALVELAPRLPEARLNLERLRERRSSRKGSAPAARQAGSKGG